MTTLDFEVEIGPPGAEEVLRDPAALRRPAALAGGRTATEAELAEQIG
ncbi:MAG: hypothetical protein ACRDSZ_23475 [Pseudonocardiaceae bacterium]